MSGNFRLTMVSCLTLAMAMTTSAFAQDAQPSGAATEQERSDRDVVVVTAQKREETVQDIAVAVTALTSDTKQQLGIISVTDLTNVTPGLSYTPGNERVTLRGIGRLSNSFGADPGVANYNDGIYTPFAVFAGKDPLLIERVEVLRGPQGTLYGRNAIGGAINTISKRPTDDFEIDSIFGFGNYGATKVGVAVSGPITDDLRYRASGFRESREGIDFNYGTSEQEGWEIDDTYLELQLEGDVGERFSWWLKIADYEFDKAGPPGGRTATFSTTPNLPGVFQTGGLGPRPDFAYGDPSVVSYTQDGDRTDNPFATNREHSYNGNYEANATLPAYDEAIFEAIYQTDAFDIKFTAGYTFYDYVLFGEGDEGGEQPVTSITYDAITSVSDNPLCGGGEALPQVIGFPTSTFPAEVPAGLCYSSALRTIHPNILNIYRESRSLFSNELNLISTTDGPLQWLVGLYQYQENSEQPGQSQFYLDEPLADFYQDPLTGGRTANPGRRSQLFSNTSLFNAYGAYGQIDYTLNDQWKATLGLRWSKDMKESKEEAFLACFILCRTFSPAITTDFVNITELVYGSIPGATITPEGVAQRRLKDSWEAVTGTAGVEYRPIDDTLLFGRYSRGYKAGGFNNLGFGALPFTDPEFVDSYEAGWKQEWSDWGLTTNAAAFLYNYSDVQSPLDVVTNPGQPGSTTFTAFVNVPEVETIGFELESTWNPVDPLEIGFTYAYLKTEIIESDTYVDASRGALDPLNTRSLEGNSLAQSPEHKVALNASYRFEFDDGSFLLPTVSYSWRDSFFDTFFNNENEKSPAYDNLDARLNWFSSGGQIGITAWVRNAFDEEQTTSISANGFRAADGGRYQTFSFAPPRTFGVDFIFRN